MISKLMNKTLLLTIVGSLSMTVIPAPAQEFSGDAWNFNPSYNTSGSTGSYGQIGGEFQLVANDVPAGDTILITALGYYSVSGAAPSVNINISLWGGSATRGFTGSSGDLLTTAQVASGTAVSSDGFAWVTLNTPIALVAGDYYNLLESAASGNVTYYQPYTGGGTTGPAVATAIGGSPFALVEGEYSNGGFAYSDSEYLGPGAQFLVDGPTPVPEPSTLALLASAFGIGFGIRRRMTS
jgi:hypothetical protein